MKTKYLILASSRTKGLPVEAKDKMRRIEFFEEFKRFLSENQIQVQNPKVVPTSEECTTIKLFMECMLGGDEIKSVVEREKKTFSLFDCINQIVNELARNPLTIAICDGEKSQFIEEVEKGLKTIALEEDEEFRIIDFETRNITPLLQKKIAA
jgi:hypothetical protein